MKDTQVFFKSPIELTILNGNKPMALHPVSLPADAEHVQYWAPPSGRSQSGWADPGVNYWTPSGNHIDPCPLGQPGDRIWGREAYLHGSVPDGSANPSADLPERTDLEITTIRIEKLHSISEADLIAAGVAVPDIPGLARFDFRALWDEMYGRGSWDTNPWVWVIEFKRIKPL